MANIFESAFMTLKNGMTMYFADSKARQLIDKLKALVDTKYGPDNPPPSTAGKIWYATCSTASGTGAKVATSSTGDFVLATGSMARVKFTTSNTAANPTISIDGSTAKTIQPKSGTSGMANLIAAGEVVDLVYDGTNFIMTKGGSATTTFYGITKLNSATNSTSTTEAATPSAVKSVYDITQTINDKIGSVTMPTTAQTLTGAVAELDADIKTYTRPNLLDNWYFVGGGSQKGVGYFPINSKGQTVYTTANAICIDRWTAATTSVTLRGWGMEIQASNSNEHVTQVLDGGFDAFAGKTLTFSAIVNDRLVLRTFTVGTTQPSGYTIYGENGDIPKVKVRFVWATNPNAYRFQFVCSDVGGVTYTIKAAKLELGDSQTLAHQVNGTWVLNEVPNYAEEQVRCGVYTPTYQKGESVNLGGAILIGTKLGSGVVVCSVTLPKAVPQSLTITNTLAVGWVRGNGIGDSSGLSVSSVTRSTDNVLQIGVSGSTIPTLQACVVNISSGNISFS